MLKTDFFKRPAVIVAEELLGTFLVRRCRGRKMASMIVETEAYGGIHDKASHAQNGRTPRNAPMFDEAGTIYVYFTYGMHWMLNMVTGEKEHPAAVLIRGLHDVTGPARITKKFNIDKRFNHKKLGRETGLWVEDRGVKVARGDIRRTPRIGVAYAGLWAKKPYRFVLKSLHARPLLVVRTDS